MNCAKCDGQLHRIVIDTTELERCDLCEGLWFDAAELGRVLGQKSVDALKSRARPQKTDDDRRGRCPKCRGGGQLVRIASRVGDFHIDTCAICGGQWLDAGELDALRQEGFSGRVRRLINWIVNYE